jgi:hypothetical protein
MRFSLLTLMVTTAVAIAVVCLWWRDGTLGLILPIPLLMLVFGVNLLLRLKRSLSAYSLLAAYATCWAVTAVFGPAAANYHIRSRTNETNVRFLDADPAAKEDFDSEPKPGSWCFIGNYSVPCPFVVSLDHSWRMPQGFGGGERLYFGSCGGSTWIVHSRLEWNSCP